MGNIFVDIEYFVIVSQNRLIYNDKVKTLVFLFRFLDCDLFQLY